jgi:hypothetical protein
MAKKIFILVLMVAFAFSAVAMGGTAKTMPMKKARILTGNEALPEGPVYPLNPNMITESPGVVVGTTHYDYQSNGSSGNRMVVCTDGSKFFAWMNGLNYPRPRHIYFNWVDASGSWFSDGVGDRVNNDSVGGYCQVSLYNGTRGAVSYHGPANSYSKIAIDADPPGFGIFSYGDPPDLINPGAGRAMWPYIAVDRNNRIHVTMSESSASAGDPQRFMYARSTNNGSSWTAIQFVDTVMTIAGLVTASPVSDKVVIAYSKTTDTSTQWYNDIVYILSNDGLTWNFTNRTNITNYGTDEDSLWAYTDLDAVFDYNDNLNVIWTAQWVTESGIYYRTELLFYNSGTQQITSVTNPWPDSLWASGGCDFGVWNRSITKMNLGVYHENSVNGIFATWTQFDTADCSSGGYANGDIYMSYSINNGATWATPVNVTNSQTPGCFAGECDSDHWSSLADVVDDSLHIFYVNDKDAGGLPQTEGANTENPMMYLAVPNPLSGGINDASVKPTNFTLAQNYPNPFNAKTVVSFELKEATPVKVEVFDVTGARVTTLINQRLSAGAHQVTWNAENVSSGVYYYKLTAGSTSESKQMVLLK